MAPSPAVVGEQAGDGVLLRVLHALHVRRHVCDVNGVLFLTFLCRGAWRFGGGGVPVEPWPRDVGQVVLGGRPVLGRGPCWLRGWGGGAAERWTGVSRAPSCGVGAAGGDFAGQGGRGPRGCLLRARVPAGLGPYAVPCPPCVGAPALAGCRCPGPWLLRGRAGVLLYGAVGVLCWCSGYVRRPVRSRAPVPREARDFAWLWCESARWWLSWPVVSPLGAVRVVAGGGR